MNERLAKLNAFLAENPTDSFILFAISKEYENLNDFEQAKEHFVKLLQKDENYVGAYYHLGKCYEKLTEFENANETYKKGMLIAKTNKDLHALSELAGAKLNLGFDDEDEF